MGLNIHEIWRERCDCRLRKSLLVLLLQYFRRHTLTSGLLLEDLRGPSGALQNLLASFVDPLLSNDPIYIRLVDTKYLNICLLGDHFYRMGRKGEEFSTFNPKNQSQP